VRFNDFVQSHTPTEGALPLTHATDAFTLRDVMETDTLKATPCPVFNGTDLLYLFYGRASYRPNLNTLPNSLSSYAPVCFILKPEIATAPKRVHPFDTGAFADGKFDATMHRKMRKERFELTSQLDSARKLVTAFFGTNAQYFDGVPRKDVTVPTLAYEAESYLALVSNRQTEEFDDRSSAVEVQLDRDVALIGAVEAVVLPASLVDDPEVAAKLMTWRADPIPYHTIARMKPSEYTGAVVGAVREFLKRSGRL
jgi:hypothetical protein